jgi:predicted esterase YcpF (UPF0227 family)
VNILYIHGFRSTGEGSSKFEALKEFTGHGGKVIAPTLTHENLAVDYQTLILLARNDQIDFVVGTSLGGFLADAVGGQLGIDTLLINPVVKLDHVPKYEGKEFRNFKTGEKFIFDPRAKEILEIINPYPGRGRRKLSVALGIFDESLDYRHAIECYGPRDNCTVEVYNDDHRFNKEFDTAVRHVIG